VAAYLEATQLAGFAVDEARKFFGAPRGLQGLAAEFSHDLRPWTATEATARYIETFTRLQP
jgi:hypothetical protein